MNLFELNARMAVKLNQSLETLYDLEYLEYSMLLNIVNEDIKQENNKKAELVNSNSPVSRPPSVNLPSHLKFK